MARFLVYATAAFFVLYGVGFALFPLQMSLLITDGHPVMSSSIIDSRATYGGAQFAIGLLMWLVVKLRDDVDLGLLMVAVTLLSMAAGRAYGIVVDGQANWLMYVYLVAEIGFGIMALKLRNTRA